MNGLNNVIIAGGGLAGSEAAWQLAECGVAVTLYEMRPARSTPAHKTDRLAELVCSNSLKSNAPGAASWLLKEELRRGGSLLLRLADDHAVPGGAALAAALVIAAVPRSAGSRARSSESAIIGTVQAFALACGALFVSLYGGFLSGLLTSLLFGSFLGISASQVIALLAVAIVAVALLALIARPLFFATVDPDVAAARGVPVRMLSTIFLILLGLAAAEVSQITGALLAPA